MTPTTKDRLARWALGLSLVALALILVLLTGVLDTSCTFPEWCIDTSEYKP